MHRVLLLRFTCIYQLILNFEFRIQNLKTGALACVWLPKAEAGEIALDNGADVGERSFKSKIDTGAASVGARSNCGYCKRGHGGWSRCSNGNDCSAEGEIEIAVDFTDAKISFGG